MRVHLAAVAAGTDIGYIDIFGKYSAVNKDSAVCEPQIKHIMTRI